ncbi:MAG: transcription antitermination factor NusB [Candidatus Dadabacteria bacterium]|nr:transcription antitermination factor NusB [Candidatus Dadabacteria bacterium]NIQ13833.1 transcription antitermination factor NusB [Candidatus Dadabacteria bacterium]
MGKRRISREIALQFLYQYDNMLNSGDINEKEFSSNFDLFCSTFNEKPQTDVLDFSIVLASGTCENIQSINNIIKNYSENWRISRMSKIDRNILRMSIYEIVYLRSIPPAVTINEAVEIAKKFGSEDSASFVNGILDKVNIASQEGELNYD